jgi:molecular chaperone DnaK
MVKDAEEHAAEDSARREEADTRNRAEQLAYQTEKVLDDSADKVPADVADEVKDAIAAVKKALEGEDTDAVKSAYDDLSTKAQKIGEAIYAKQAEETSGDDAGPAASDDDVVDAEIVDEDESK